MTNSPSKPQYRVRLFLSVDLVGSTNFKSNNGNNSDDWLRAFQKFYGNFPSLFSEKYNSFCAENGEIEKDEKKLPPKVWKTIGDEILFVNRVLSISHLGAYITAFSESLIEFGREMKSSFDLNTKGNAWIAAFPDPNRSIHLSRNGDGDPLSGNYDLLTEEFEAQVDDAPYKYDFLGKGIDAGFRIARNSSVESFTISPALALLLCKAKRNSDTTGFDCDFRFHEPQSFKGVLNGSPYPIISIDTNRDKKVSEIQVLQAKLLQQPEKAGHEDLAKYLDAYIAYNEIEKPALKLSSASASEKPPKHYEDYIAQWEIEAKKLEEQQQQEIAAAEKQDEFESDPNENQERLNAVFKKILDQILESNKSREN